MYIHVDCMLKSSCLGYAGLNKFNQFYVSAFTVVNQLFKIAYVGNSALDEKETD